MFLFFYTLQLKRGSKPWPDWERTELSKVYEAEKKIG